VLVPEDIEIRDVLADPRRTGVMVSETDKTHLVHLRKFVTWFMKHGAAKYPAVRPGARLLDVAPQDHAGAVDFEAVGYMRETADLVATTNPTYVMDITKDNSDKVTTGFYDAIVCTEVLEHTLQPFDGMRELARLLRPNGGLLFLTVPCNFRIHGPLPDSWRFTEHGVLNLAASAGLEALELHACEAPGRALFPVDYAAVLRKP
jgi:SAM-dependent methyltransferase